MNLILPNNFALFLGLKHVFTYFLGGPESQQAFNQLMQQMVTSMAGQGLNAPPEERFRTQLETLASMGFVDRQANIQGTCIL